MDSQTLDLASLLARRELWLLVSAGFVDPHHRKRWEIIRDPVSRRHMVDASALVGQEHSGAALGPGEVDPRTLAPRRLFEAFDVNEETLEAAYRQIFGLTTISQCCPPCEIEYEPNAEVAYRSQRLADIAGFYRAFGMQVSTRAAERLDHITVEAEFLYLLLAKEAAAWETGNLEGAEVCRDARRKFFQEHVGWWVPAFARLLSHLAPPGYYRQLAALTAALLASERVSLGLPPFKPRVVPRPSGIEAEATCFKCAGCPQDS